MPSEAIRAAADRCNRPLIARGSTQAETGISSPHEAAQQERADAFQALADGIPKRLRTGRNRGPDALREWQHCRLSP